MNLEKLRERIKPALQNPNMTTTERVILSTLLYNDTYQTAFKLRLGINQVEKVINQFKTKLMKGTSWENKIRVRFTSRHYLQKLFTPTPRAHIKTLFDTSIKQIKQSKTARARHQPPKNNRSKSIYESLKTLKTFKRIIKNGKHDNPSRKSKGDN